MESLHASPAAHLDAASRSSHRRPRDRRINIVLFLLDTAFFFFAISLVDMSSVMPALLGHLTRQPVFIGLIGSAQTACWLLPQLLVARIVAGRRHKLPIVLFGTGISRLGWVFLFGALLFPDVVGPDLTLLAAFVAMGLFFLFDGVATLAWYDLVARAVPSTMRGRMFGVMSLSGIFAIAGGLVVRQIIGSPARPFPADYRMLVGVALVALAIGYIPLCLVQEPEGEPVPPTEPFGSYVRRLPGLLRERPTFRRLIQVQLFVGASALAVPFYAPFAVKSLHFPEADVGTFVVGTTVGSMAGGFVWGYLADRGLKHVAIRALSTFALLAPLIALAMSLGYQVIPVSVGTVVVTTAMFAVGCSTRSSWVAYANVVMDLGDVRDRPILIGLMNTLSGTLAIMPPLGGLLVGWLGYEAAFAAASIPAAAGLFLSFGLRVPKAIQTK